MVALALTIAASGRLAQAQPARPTTGPRIKTDVEIFDFGFVPQNTVVSHTFWLKNTGTAQAHIDKLVPNCGCTQVPPTDSVIAVGDSLPVEVLFGTRGMIGHVEKFVRIMSNAVGRVPALTIHATAVKDGEPTPGATLSPSHLRIGKGASLQEAKVKVQNTGKTKLAFRTIEAPEPWIRVNPKEFALDTGQKTTLQLQIQRGTGDKFTKSVTWEAVGDSLARFTLPISDSLAAPAAGSAAAH
jgi:hypothetical protein